MVKSSGGVSNTRGASEHRAVEDINERRAGRTGRCKVFRDLQDKTLSTRLDIDVGSAGWCIVVYALDSTVVTNGWGSGGKNETNLRLVRPLSRAMNISSSSRYRLAPSEGSKGSIRYRVQDSKVRTGIR